MAGQNAHREKIQYFVKQGGDTGRPVSETKATNRRRATWPEIFTLRIKSQINRIMGVMQAIKNLDSENLFNYLDMD